MPDVSQVLSTSFDGGSSASFLFYDKSSFVSDFSKVITPNKYLRKDLALHQSLDNCITFTIQREGQIPNAEMINFSITSFSIEHSNTDGTVLILDGFNVDLNGNKYPTKHVYSDCDVNQEGVNAAKIDLQV